MVKLVMQSSSWILNNIFKKNSKKMKTNFLIEIGAFFVSLENPREVGFLGGDFVIFWPKEREILNVEFLWSSLKKFSFSFHNWALTLGS